MDQACMDAEHTLIERYAARLAVADGVSLNDPSNSTIINENNLSIKNSDYKLHKEIIDELEASNKHIMEEIRLLQKTHDIDDSDLNTSSSSDLSFELQLLKQHKGELENRMSKLQDGRRELIEQLEKLMKLLKNRDIEEKSMLNLETSIGKQFGGKVTPPAQPIPSISRTRRQFGDLFDAADAISHALSHLVDGTNLPGCTQPISSPLLSKGSAF